MTTTIETRTAELRFRIDVEADGRPVCRMADEVGATWYYRSNLPGSQGEWQTSHGTRLTAPYAAVADALLATVYSG